MEPKWTTLTRRTVSCNVVVGRLLVHGHRWHASQLVAIPTTLVIDKELCIYRRLRSALEEFYPPTFNIFGLAVNSNFERGRACVPAVTTASDAQTVAK